MSDSSPVTGAMTSADRSRNVVVAPATFGAAPMGTDSERGESLPLVPSGRAVPWVLSTYFAEGLPYSLVHQVSSQFFTAIGASLSVIGLTSLYGLAWNIKFLWSPLVDRFGTARRWLVACQLVLALVVALIAWSAGTGAVGNVAMLFIVVSLIAATHDVATDGYYLTALGKSDQTRLAGHRVVAYRVALWAGQGGLVALAGLTSFRLCFFVAAVVLAVLGVVHGQVLPRPIKDESLATRGVGLSFLEAVSTFLAKPRAGLTIAFLLVFRAGDALMFAMNAPFLLSLGLDTSRRGVVQGLGGALFSIIGSLWGFRLIARRSLRATIFPIAVAQSLAILAYVAMAFARPTLPFVVAGVFFEQLVAGVGTAAFTIFILRRSAGQFKASHFAFCTALMSVATSLAGAPSGFVATAVGFPAFFGLAFLMSLPGVFLARAVPHEADD